MSHSRKKRATRLRGKSFIFTIIIAIVPTIAVSWALISSALSKETDNIVGEMQGQVLVLANQLSSDDYISHYADSDMNTAIEQIADIWGGRIQIMNYAGKILTDTYHVDTTRYNISEYVLSALSRQTVSYMDEKEMIVALAQPIYSATETELVTPLEDLEDGEEAEYQSRIDGVILVTADISKRVSALSSVNKQMYLFWGLAAAIIIAVAAFIVSKLFRPLSKLVEDIDQSTDGSLKKVSVQDYYETSRISEAVNRSLARVKSLSGSRQQFVSNVSHELKTPITSMRVLADTINSTEDASIDQYKEFMQDISSELEREGQIIDDLLSMSRLEEDEAALNIDRINLNDWLTALLKRLSPIARAAEVDILFETFKPIEADVDEIKLGLAVTNIVENAIKYNKEGGFVKVSLNADQYHFFIKIEDSGIGIPPEAMPHLFERFYRVDEDRARESGGTGLGLSISKQIINLHHGAVRAHSQLDQGSSFVIRIPVEYREDEKAEEDADE